MKAHHRRMFIIASPILIIIIGNLAAQFFASLLDRWAWIGVFPVYWGSMLLIIKLFSPKRRAADPSTRPTPALAPGASVGHSGQAWGTRGVR